MKKLACLRMRDRFVFAPEEAKKLGLTGEKKNTVFVLVVNYSQNRVKIGDTTTGTGDIGTMEQREVSGDLLVIPKE